MPGFVGTDLSALTGAAGVIAVKRIFKQLTDGTLILPEASENVGQDTSMAVDAPPMPPANIMPSIIPFFSLASQLSTSSIAHFLSAHPPPLTETRSYVGESKRAVRLVFSHAHAPSPCVIFFNELEPLVPRRDESMSESSACIVNMLLTELDGLDSCKAVYIIATINRPDMINLAMLVPRTC
ncbi:AAA-domain-containing protein [Suillus hirtellus]|nr:AAA-domain-containing protein [Suillus hirtellus]